jgi:hypothetical protein
VTLRKPWASIAQLKAETLAECELRFARRFERPWNPACAAGLRNDFDKLVAVDEKVGAVLAALRRADELACATVAGLDLGGLDPIRASLAGLTHRSAQLAFWVRRHGGHAPAADAAAPTPAALRSFIVARWQVVHFELVPYEPPPPLGGAQAPVGIRWGPARSKQIALTASELAAVCLLCGCWPAVDRRHLTRAITPADVIHLEGANVRDALEHLDPEDHRDRKLLLEAQGAPRRAPVRKRKA